MRGQVEDALIRLALLELEQEAAQRLIDDIESGKSEIKAEELDAALDVAQQSAYRRISRKFRVARAARFARHTLPRIGVAAAALVLTFFVALTTAVATVESVRVSLMNFLINIEKEYTELSLGQSEDGFFVPGDWQGGYFPSYIPEGYALSSVSGASGTNSAIYVNEENDFLLFEEYDVNTEVNINTEGARIRYVSIRDTSALLAELNGIVTITWPEFDRYFIVTFQGDADSSIQIAKSVRRIH